MNKKVSVIIPTYGGPDFLERCVNSVLTQTYSNIEAVVVDDNGLSTEQQLKTEEVMKQYAGDGRVKYVCHDVNINGSAARNTGVKFSSGDYIALMDDDDEFYPNKIERQVKVLESAPDNVGLTYCSFDLFIGSKRVAVTHAKISGSILYECMMHQVIIPSTSILVRKSVYNAIGGFDESFRRHQDWEFVDRLAEHFLIQADDFVGFRRNLEFRNNPETPEIFKERRLYYLNKMMPLIKKMSKSQQKDILVKNRMDVVFTFMKHHRFKEAIFEYSSAKPGLRGLMFVFQRILTIIRRRKFTVA